MDAVEKAQSGHPGMPMGMADVATVLFTEFLNFNSHTPDWPNRDRFILSAGHGSMLLYSLLYLTGYSDITIDDIKNFRQLKAKTAGHPEHWHIAGIETTTGPLGQGFANAIGMAIAERKLAARFGEVVDHYTYVIAGDGCLMEGISYEAASLAGHLELGKLIVLFDDNSISIDGPTSLTVSEDQLARFRATNWHVQSIDGHNFEQIRAAIKEAKASPLPSLIACKTVIAYGAPTKAGSESSHGSPLGDKEISGARLNLEWPHLPFEIPDELLSMWRRPSEAALASFKNWQELVKLLTPELAAEYHRLLREELPSGWEDGLQVIKAEAISKGTAQATRKSSGKVLEYLATCIPELFGGSADLTGSNDTKNSHLKPITKHDFSGRYIYYGVREHAMAAIMNGGTFLVFTDYCRPAIRLSALMKQRVIYIMTHDSIGLGEDGPTHQPIEHLASLRAIPNLMVYRPADAVETVECWQLALQEQQAPSILALSRQNLPIVRSSSDENFCAKGAYIISECQHALKVTIFATGSEVQIALSAQTELEAQKIGTRVISMPCDRLFERQELSYKEHILNNNSLKVAIEAANSYGWERYIGRDGIFIGMEGFGASAKAEDLYKHFGITTEQVIKKILYKLRGSK
jgi:transketolase